MTNFNNMFRNCRKFNKPFTFPGGNSQHCEYMFYDCIEFNQPIDFSAVTSMNNAYYMFGNAQKFNQPVRINCNGSGYCFNNMEKMFYNCRNFNQPVYITNAFNCNYMFQNCVNLNSDVTIIPKASGTYFNYAFANCYNLSVVNFHTGAIHLVQSCVNCYNLRDIYIRNISAEAQKIVFGFQNKPSTSYANSSLGRYLYIHCSSFKIINGTNSAASVLGVAITWNDAERAVSGGYAYYNDKYSIAITNSMHNNLH